MEQDTLSQTTAGSDTEVMAAIESGDVEQFVLADISRDDAYLTMPLTESASLTSWQ